MNQCKELMRILSVCGKATGQIVNPAKSSITFGKKIDAGIKNQIKILT